MKPWKTPAGVLLLIVGEAPLASAFQLQLTPTPSVDRALSCLRLTTPDLQLAYPPDAEQHVQEIYDAMLPWQPNLTERTRWSYNIEDVWMTDVRNHWKNRSKEGVLLSELFGPYVPVFSYWAYPWVSSDRHSLQGMRYPEGMMKALRGVLRKDVPYVTASQCMMGLSGWDEFRYAEYPNLLVMSAGGYGHAAMPLHLTDTGADSSSRTRSTTLLSHQNRRGPISERKYFVSFAGNLLHGPVRQPMVNVLQDFVARHGNNSDLVAIYRGKDWEKVVSMNSKFSLVPRGSGRTAYHLAETIQLGLIPIYIYDDMPWIPFPEIYKEFGFQTTVEGLPQLLDRLLQMPDEEVQALEQKVAKYAESHFTPEAEMWQMWRFLTGKEGGGDIVCRQLPPSAGVLEPWPQQLPAAEA